MEFEIFKNYPNLIYTVSEKKDGTMKLSGDLLKDKNIIKNREKFLEKFGIEDRLTIKADLVHGGNVEFVSIKESGKIIDKTDGLITTDKNLFLTVTVADCLPIFIYDPEKEIVGLIHGGWRNLAKDILAVAVGKMVKNFGSSSEDILVGIGPGISQCHFEVKNDVLAEFKPYLKEVLLKKEGKSFLDLKKIARIQLINSGIKEENIEISPECTFCLSDKYFSFRRVRPESPETMIAVIGRK